MVVRRRLQRLAIAAATLGAAAVILQAVTIDLYIDIGDAISLYVG
jgi:hypothetical protein